MTDTAIIIGVGAHRGLGAALARRFAAGGMNVLIAGLFDQVLTRVLLGLIHNRLGDN